MEKTRLVEQVRTAEVSEQTRGMLEIMALFLEVSEKYYFWCDKYLGTDNKVENEFRGIFEEVYNCIEETLTDCILENMSMRPCREI